MSRWSNLFGGGGSNDELPDTLETTRGTTGDSAFEVFIEGALTSIYNAANGRHKDQRQIRESCKRIVDSLNDSDAEASKKVSAPLSTEAAEELLEPLRLACGQDAPRLVEPALACLHKLVAHAYLQAESTPAGRLDDNTTVSQVVSLVSKCGESHSEAVQLAVIRALLTITTAEHFVVHGDSLMQAVRTVFNVAIGSESVEIQRTARSALLQMLNTVVKRVTSYSLSQRSSSVALQAQGSFDHSANSSHQTAAPTSDATNTADNPTQPAVSSHAQTDSNEEQQPSADDSQGQESDGAAAQQSRKSQDGGVDEGEREQQPADSEANDGRTAHLASLAEQADIRGLEKALDHYSQPAALTSASDAVGSDEKGKDARRNLMRERRKKALKNLSMPERDVLTVLSAVCKMAARETGIGAVETFMHAGKLLALDLLVKVLEHQGHTWSHVRQEFCEQLRQPLCLALLRNCMSPYDEAFTAATKLFTAVLLQPKLRGGLKAELGAFFPLLLLRPLEADRPDMSQLTAVLDALQALCAEGQVMVDLFVNYDCDLQAANLFERSMKGLSKLLRRTPTTAPFSSPQAAKAREVALEAVLSILKSLNKWADPLKEAAIAAVSGEDAAELQEQEGMPSGFGSTSSLPGSHSNGGEDSEVARFGAAKEKKHSLENGISVFNRDSIKGVRALVASGSVEASPEAIAAFLRQHNSSLNKEQLGEYLGHHDELEVSVMHAFIDEGNYSGLTIDKALRQMLKDFKLPGEAQKIDRIMERFAERYCKDNPDVFQTSDGAYLLSFALIMLNTDAHNPMADKKLSLEDFVSMCQYQAEDSSFQPILPEDEIAQIYQRILETEIEVAGGTQAQADGGADSKAGSSAQNLKLAAAMGLTQLMLPFRTGATWDKQHGVDVERQRLLAQTRDLVNKGLQADHLWHTATHADYARPMLQVSGEAVMKGLQAALENAPSALAARSVLEGFDIATSLAGALGLERLTESLVDALAQAAGVSKPAQPGTPAEAKQVAALEALLQLAMGPRAGLLGSGWVLVLRTLSALQALQASFAASTQNMAGPPPPTGTPAATPRSSNTTPRLSRQSSNITPTFTGNPHHFFGTAPPPPTAEEVMNANPETTMTQPPSANKLASFGKFWQGMTSGSQDDGSQPISRRTTGDTAGDDSEVARAQSALSQRKSLRPSLSRSPTLSKSSAATEKPGAAMAAWAVGPGASAIDQVYACSGSLNGEAVLVFVRALCAVSQEELNPAQATDIPRVYSLQRLIECAYHNLNRIRLIWSRLWAALAPHLVSAACHANPKVAAYAVDALRQLVAKLLVRAERAELTSFTHQDEALRPFVAVLKHCDSAAVREQTVQCIAQAITAHPRGLGSGWRSVLEVLIAAAADSASAVVNQALDALQPVIAALYADVGVGHQHFLGIVTAVAATMRSPYHAELSISAVHVMQSVAQRLSQSDPRVWDTPSIALKMPFTTPAPSRRPSEAGSHAPRSEAGTPDHPWGLVLGQFATVARHDPRPEVADEAVAVLLEVVQAFSSQWESHTWHLAFTGPLAYLFDLPKSQLAADEDVSAVVGWSVEGLLRMERHGRLHLPSLFTIQLDQYQAAGADCLQQVLSLLVRYIVESNDESMALLGVSLLQQLVQSAVTQVNDKGWECIVGAFQQGCSFHSLETLLSDQSPRDSSPGQSMTIGSLPKSDALRYRCHTILSLQRVMAQLHAKAAAHMPPQAQLKMLAVLQESVQDAANFNYNPSSRATAQKCLLHALDEDPTSVLPAQAIIELSEDMETTAEEGSHAQMHGQQQEEEEELPTSTPAVAAAAASDHPNRSLGPPQTSDISEIEPQDSDDDADADADTDLNQQAIGSASGSDPIPVSSTAAVTSTPTWPVPVAPAIAHPESIAAKSYQQQSQDQLLDSAMDIRPGQNNEDAQTQKPKTVSGGTVSDAASLAASHAVATNGVQEKGVRTAAAAAAAALAPEVDDVMWPALMRQEAEGGVLLIEALKRSLQSGDEAVAPEAQERMLEVCRQVITRAAQDTWQQTDGHSQHAGAAHHVTDGTSWEQAIRAPLIVTVLESYYSIHNEAWTSELQAIFPHLAKLVCSAQPTVRKALGQLMRANLPYALEDIPT
ncbi:hypothetical protein WJX77_003623 [Trebouxia sp. C0004]